MAAVEGSSLTLERRRELVRRLAVRRARPPLPPGRGVRARDAVRAETRLQVVAGALRLKSPEPSPPVPRGAEASLSSHSRSLWIRPRGHGGDAGLRRQPVVVATGRRNRSGLPVPVLLHGRQQRVVRVPVRLHVHARPTGHSHVRPRTEPKL